MGEGRGEGYPHSFTLRLLGMKAIMRASALSGEGTPRRRMSSLLSITSWPRLLKVYFNAASCPTSSLSAGICS